MATMDSISELRSFWQEKRDTVRTWLESVTEYPVLHQGQSEPGLGNQPHLIFKMITGLNKVGSFDEQRPIAGNNPNFQIIGRRTFTASITAVGHHSDDIDERIEATHILELVRFSLSKQSVKDLLCAAGLSVRSENPITDVSELLETDTEPRAVLDVEFGVAIDGTEDQGRIDRVTGDGSFDTDFDGNRDDVTVSIDTDDEN